MFVADVQRPGTLYMAVLRSRYGARVDVVDVRLSPDLPDADCEPTHLDQVLSNLIGNALEYARASLSLLPARGDTATAGEPARARS